eukprot:TRINITY_DN1579_c0_g1_i1.p1 TRINITY_DN1579_c0_g1~~TRINITY_DN1579_c0_g1_i1.p1  ORF type:complete len:128 (+),score=40.93 TRINITY_DN1579_c0_g1_i1:113-496(+)
MAFEQPSASFSSLVSGFLFLLSFSLLESNRVFLASSPKLTILGGFLSSFLFLLSLLTLGNLTKEIRWIEVIISLVLACTVAGTIHRVCITVCFLFSVVQILYVSKMSSRINKKLQDSAPSAVAGKRR